MHKLVLYHFRAQIRGTGKAQKIKIAQVYKRYVVFYSKDPFVSEKNVENGFKPRPSILQAKNRVEIY